ncbi:MAG: LPS export ABC transporter permease LptF [Pseudomonadota bacterium]
MLRVLDRYLLREVVHGWLAITLVLWFVLISNRLVRYLAKAAAGELPGDVILTLLAVKTFWFLVYIMPFSLALGVVIGLGRMYRDNEMTVLGACGVGPARIYQPLLAMGLVVALLLGWAALSISPSVSAYGDTVEKQAKQSADVSLLMAGRFNSIRGGRMTFYSERLSDDRKRMENLFVYVKGKPAKETPPQVVVADSAYRMTDPETGDDYIVFVDGTHYEGTPGKADYRVMNFHEQGVRIEVDKKTGFLSRGYNVPTDKLMGSPRTAYIAELQWRLSVPISVMVLLVLSVPLGSVSPRQGKHSGTVVSVLVFLTYYNLLGTARAWVEQGDIPPQIGLWWVHLLPLALALLLLNRNRLSRLLRLRR